MYEDFVSKFINKNPQDTYASDTLDIRYKGFKWVPGMIQLGMSN